MVHLVISGTVFTYSTKCSTCPNLILIEITYSYFLEYLLTSNFYINGEKVKPFLATDFCTNTKKLNFVNKKELKKLKKIARRQKKCSIILPINN